MTKFVGRRGQLGIAVESTRGTPVSPVFWVPVATMSFQDRTEEAREDQGLGIIADSDSKYVTQKMGEGEVEAQIYDKAFGAIFNWTSRCRPPQPEPGRPIRIPIH